jgi:hypothetical protein
VKRGYRIRFAREGYRIIDAEGREVRRIVVLRMRDWLRGWRMASKTELGPLNTIVGQQRRRRRSQQRGRPLK